MLILIWLVLCLAAAFVLLLPLLLTLHAIYERYSGSRLVACPENQQSAAVNIDAGHAAATGVDGGPELVLRACTRWPEHGNCGQACLSQAVHAAPYAPPAVKLRRKQIYHSPIFLAAFAAWCVGAFWHAQYLLRPQWMDAVGLTHAQVKQIVWWLSPHLLTAAVWVLFAYGVASLLALFGRKGILQGILMAALLGGVLAAASGYSIARMPHGLLMMEATYLILAIFMVGAIVGGFEKKLALAPQ